MIRYKYLKDCQVGDWVYYLDGELAVVGREDDSEFFLSTGYIRAYVDQMTKVYPLNIHNKIIAESIRYYSDLMHKKGLIHGSKWVYWLSDRMDEVMSLPDDAEKHRYREIWDRINNKISELESIKLNSN